ncbi:hypothetical protein SAMN04488120_11245 [Fontimonas thermophila]|uniref:Uncharacterized protein n=1 Tax=Fontimonas thermophila TaxID=1076937 RepID=A0A1I2K4C3_9GAMM|nr:hypothetical protein [Fontimonas thermophila]SFF61179.1 hypothetical protein SAMN04488120_11245 [Fontimonas thermophila]
MKRLLRTAIVIVTAFCLAGCTTMRAVEAPASALSASAKTSDQVKVGDRVELYTRAGHFYALKVVSMDESSLVGRDENGKHWRVPFDQIERMQVQRIDALKTAGAVGAGLVVLWAAAIAAFAYAVKHAFDDLGQN